MLNAMQLRSSSELLPVKHVSVRGAAYQHVGLQGGDLVLQRLQHAAEAGRGPAAAGAPPVRST